MAKVKAASSGINDPGGDDKTRLCIACNDYKPRVAFPKRQWPKKDRRCKYCIASNLPFYRPKKKEPVDDMNTEPASVELGNETEPSTPPSVATFGTERSEEFSVDESHQGDHDEKENSAQNAIEEVKQDSTRSPVDAAPDNHKIEAKGKEPEEFSGEPSRRAGNNTSHLPASAIVKETERENMQPPVDEPATESGRETEGNETEVPSPEGIADPEGRLEEDIEDLARNWSPSIPESLARNRAPPPSSAPPEPPGSIDSSANGGICWREFGRLLALPVLDESGSAKPVSVGLFSLFVVGSLIGVVSKKNPSLPTLWYQYVSAMIGYTYFLGWSISFYFQVITNYKRKTTAGLSPDFCALNVLGFACYSAYNASLFWSPTIRHLYREKYGSEVTVQSNDVAFAIHALVLSSVTLGQIVYYRGSERPSKSIIGVIVLLVLLCAIYPILVYEKLFTWLDYLYVLSYIKIGVSVIKYIPQVVLNYRRKSTVGWSIWNILLDFTGGGLSDLQLVLDCADMGDFSGITGNLAKFGLGFVSIMFDIIFITQHYILYPEARRERGEPGRPETVPLLSEGNRHEAFGEDAV